MANCCICGRRIGGFGEDKLKLAEDKFACYKCAPLFRYMKDSDDPQKIDMYEKKIWDLVKHENAPEDVRKVVKLEIDKIKANKEELFRQKQFAKENEEEILKRRKQFLITTGYNFEGYRIKKYLNLAHGELVLGTGFFSELESSVSDFFGSSSTTFEGKISKAKRAAQEKMITDAMSMGANALIGVDFDVTTFTNNMIGVSANGTAVVIEKDSE